jgi:hypothetical protein
VQAGLVIHSGHGSCGQRMRRNGAFGRVMYFSVDDPFVKEHRGTQ